MRLTGLNLPKWESNKPKPQLGRPAKWKTVDPGPAPPRPTKRRVLSQREEVKEEAAKAKSTVTVQIRGAKGMADGEHKFAYFEGRSLGEYLDLLGLRHVAMRLAVYDHGNLEAGRLRMIYTPGPDSKIVVGPPGLGPMSHLQRSSHDAQTLASRMSTEEVNFVALPSVRVKKSETMDGIQQW